MLRSGLSAIRNRLRRRSAGTPRALLLLYHRVATPAFDPFGLAVTPQAFASHLRLLRSRYHVEALESLIEQLPRGEFPDRTVVVTFDDGYVDNVHAALPIAAAADVPITVFVTVRPMVENRSFWWDDLATAVCRAAPPSGFLRVTLDTNHTFRVDTGASRETTCRELHALLRRMSSGDRDRVLSDLRAPLNSNPEPSDTGRPMTVAELREAARLPGFGIGAHTMSHPILRALSAADQTAELEQSRRRLEEILGQPVSFTAYPFGKSTDFSALTCSLAAQAGYRAALTSQPARLTPLSPLYALPRLSVHEWTEGEFLRKVSACLGAP